MRARAWIQSILPYCIRFLKTAFDTERGMQEQNIFVRKLLDTNKMIFDKFIKIGMHWKAVSKAITIS